MTTASKEQWTNYWQESDYINSFGRENYSQEVAEFWRTELQGQHYTRLLDLACGNGAIAWLANEILNATENQTRITGVDFSDIDPFKSLNRTRENYPMLDFIGNCALEKLPFEADTFDAAISQYGLEYSDLEQSIPELLRVLKPASALHLILHRKDSEIVRHSANNIKQFDTILRQLKIHDDFLALDSIIGSETNVAAVKNNPRFMAQWRVIETKSMLLNNIILNNNNPVALINYKQQLVEFFSDQAIARGPMGRRQSIENAKAFLSSYLLRITDLERSALSDADVEKIINTLTEHGFSIKNRQILRRENQENIGQVIVATRGTSG